MPRGTSKTPRSDRIVSVEPSPVREALGSNLDADVDLTLSKKKSWFGSFRDAVQKGALQAKAAVDSIRGDQNKSEQTLSTDGEVESDPHPRRSVESAISTTALLKPEDEPHLSHAPKGTIASLRNHLPHNAYKHHRNRSSVSTIPARPSSEMSKICGPEHFVSHNGTTTGHKRHSSMANSLVGSIRGLGRKKGKAPEASAQDIQSPERPAENVPLPSSPINIPAAAPALELDLGTAGFMTSPFPSPTENRMKPEDLKLTDPANIASARPELFSFHVAMTGNRIFGTATRGATPSDILKIPAHSTDETGHAPPTAPATPTPGSNFSLEVDGANSGKSDKSQIFERSVTPPNEKERKELRTMRSLDAMAGACTIAHAGDDISEHFSTRDMRRQSEPGYTSDMLKGNCKSMAARHWSDPGFFEAPELPGNAASPDMLKENFKSMEARRWSDPGFFDAPEPPSAAASPELEFYTPLGRAMSSLSGRTISRCPSDMEVLTRQKANEPEAGSSSRGIGSLEHFLGEDPFTARGGLASKFGRISLPFGPKVIADEERNPTTIAAGSPRSVARIADTNKENEVASLPELLSPEHATGEQTESLRNHAAVLAAGEEHSQNVASDDDTQARAEELLASDIVLLEYEHMESPGSSGLSPQGGPLLPGLYQCVKSSQTPSPGSARSRTTYTAGIGDAGYKFTFDKWLQTTSGAHAPDDEAVQTPERRSLDVSIDSVSTNGERQTPQISPMSSNEEHTPSMGNRLEFNLQRSQRNMRYNALQQDAGVEETDTAQGDLVFPSIRFILGGSEEIDANAFALADFEYAYASSNAGSPHETSKAAAEGITSEEDGSDSLQEGASNYHTFDDSVYEKETVRGTPSDADVGIPTLTSQRNWLSNSAHGHQDHNEAKSIFQDPASRYEFRRSLWEKSFRTRPIPGVDTSESETISSIQSTTSPRTEGPPDQIEAASSSHDDASESSDDLLPIRVNVHEKDRATSSDTLDDSLRLFSSPDSGYQADKSSVSSPGKSRAPAASLYRNPQKAANTSTSAREDPNKIV